MKLPIIQINLLTLLVDIAAALIYFYGRLFAGDISRDFVGDCRIVYWWQSRRPNF